MSDCGLEKLSFLLFDGLDDDVLLLADWMRALIFLTSRMLHYILMYSR